MTALEAPTSQSAFTPNSGRDRRITHSLMQWGRISVPSSDDHTHDAWLDTPPVIGSLDHTTLAALCRVLNRHTARSDACLLGMWTGWGDRIPLVLSRLGSTARLRSHRSGDGCVTEIYKVDHDALWHDVWTPNDRDYFARFRPDQGADLMYAQRVA